DDALLDEQASGETVTVFYANDDVTPQELQEAHENTDTACVEEYESAIDHDTTQDTVGDHDVEVHTWQVIASEQLTGRMIDVVSDELFIRYAAAYPPQLAEDDLPDDAATEFNDQATERALAVFEAAAAQSDQLSQAFTSSQARQRYDVHVTQTPYVPSGSEVVQSLPWKWNVQ